MAGSSTVSDTLAYWGTTCFSEKEVPLEEVANSLGSNDDRFILKKSKQYSNNLVLWDKEIDDVATITYAFIVRYASPIQTGNFVPAGCALPDNMMDYLRKSEPSNMAQIAVTFDTIENWVESQPEFDPGQRPRNPWMSPAYIASNMKFTVTSQLFQSKNAFNCKDGGYKVDYPVHSWIKDNCVPHNPLWIPNPNVVQFYDVEDMTLQRMTEGEDPELHPGDIVKMSSKLIVYSGRDTWTASFVPWHILRVGRLDKVDVGPSIQLEEHRPSYLPKAGETMTIVRGNARSSKGGGDEDASTVSKGSKLASAEGSVVDLSDLSQEQSEADDGDETEADKLDRNRQKAEDDGFKLKSRDVKIEKAESNGKRKVEEDSDGRKRVLKPRSTRGVH